MSNNDINKSIGENCRRCVYADANGKPARNEICGNCVNAKRRDFKANVEDGTKKDFTNPYADSTCNNLKQNTKSCSETNSRDANDVQQQPRQSGMAIASFVLGVVGLVFCCDSVTLFGIVFIPIQFVCSLLAIIFSLISIKNPPKGFAIAGLVTGIISMILFALAVVVFISFGMSAWKNRI